MPDTMTDDTTDTTSGLDLDAAVDQIGADLFPSAHSDEPTEPEPVTEQITSEPTATETPESTPAPAVRPAPKSWPKEMHDHWGKTPKEVQDYWDTREKQMLDGLDQYKSSAQFGKAIQEAVAPFQHILQAQGIDAPRAVATLLQAQQRLTMGTEASRRAAYEELGRHLGLTPQTMPDGQAAPADPRVQTLEQQLQQIQQIVTTQQQAAQSAAREQATKEVEAFASDPAHPLFDEVADDIARFIQQGASLQDAYDKAVWANPVTREKQVQARLQTEAEKAKERARLDALPKKKAAGVNVRERETLRPPTEPLGSMEDTMRATLQALKAR